MAGRATRAALITVLGLAAGLRLWGIDYGLPFTYHPDEPWLVGSAWRMFRTGDLDPHFWDYPTLQIYTLLGVIALREGLRDVAPLFAMPGMEYLLGRLINVGYAVGTVYLVYWTGRRLFGVAVGLLAAALLAVAQQHSLMSHFLKVDVPATFYVAATTAASVGLLSRPATGSYLLAGAMVGLTAAAKYPAATIAIAVVVAHASVWRDDAVRQIRKLLLSAAAALAAFALACPFTILNAPAFLAAFRSDVVGWAATGHDGWDGDVVITYARWLFLGRDAAMAWLAAAGAVLLYRRDRAKALLVVAFPLLFMAELSIAWVVRFPWYVLPIYPALAVLAGFGAVEIGRRLSRATRYIWVGVVVGGAAWALTAAADESASLASEEVRTTALRWIESAIPPNSRIVREGYTPELPGDRFRVTELWRAIDRDPAWYRAEQVDYLVLGNFLHGRYFRDPARYPQQIAQYRALMDAGALIQRFQGPMLGTREGVIEVYALSRPNRS